MFALGTKDLRCLPPTEDSFFLHILRATSHINTCKQAHLANPELYEPEKVGYIVKSGILLPKTISKYSKPPFVKLQHCDCKKSRCLRNCKCKKLNIACGLGCSCQGRVEKCGRLDDVQLSESDCEYDEE